MLLNQIQKELIAGGKVIVNYQKAKFIGLDPMLIVDIL